MNLSISFWPFSAMESVVEAMLSSRLTYTFDE